MYLFLCEGVTKKRLLGLVNGLPIKVVNKPLFFVFSNEDIFEMLYEDIFNRVVCGAAIPMFIRILEIKL